MTVLLSLIAIVLIMAATSLLYAKWRGQGLPAVMVPLAVPLAWGCLLASAVLWMSAYEPDFGLPVGFLIAMSLPLIIIGWQGYRGWTSAPALQRERREKAPADTPPAPGQGLRLTARLLSCLIAAPVTGMAVGIAAWAYMPGHGSTRYVWAVFFFTMSFAIALIVGLAAQRPWRATGLIVAAGAAASALVSLPILSGSV